MLLPFFEWMQAHPASLYILDTTWFSPIVQVMHLVALSVFAGSVLIVDLRLLGVGVTGTPLAKVMRDAQPPGSSGRSWRWSSPGTPSMASTAMKQYFSPFFWWKMELLLLGLIFTFTVRRQLAQVDEARMNPIWPKVAGLFSIAVWTGVSVGARLIGLLS